jgi:hypothetical protein
VPWVNTMPRRGGFRRGSFTRRRRHNWQWVRQTANSTTIVVPPNIETIDLLSGFKAAYGFSVNLPDIVVWRVRLKISLRLQYPAVLASEENGGCLIGVYCDDTLLTAEPGDIQFPYAHKWMVWEQMYDTEQIVLSGIQPASSASFYLYKEFDIKTHRRLENINHSLLMDLQPNGNVNQLSGVSYSVVALLKIGR